MIAAPRFFANAARCEGAPTLSRPAETGAMTLLRDGLIALVGLPIFDSTRLFTLPQLISGFVVVGSRSLQPHDRWFEGPAHTR